uniref:FAD/NAD(P)-binding domain-containing protein n=1 Tax=Chromera velia CCMP2878 TaxID=1169474 RepID=A0A0G4FSD1_9ALVE|eukprot:Cvel_3660.t1-p1 / transcript=Cvel_3660.t1 / gene=Cvel_3660 / organism=Chromera_velia_CCMP2878 / gene_product=hypothetical protein / transcript_product=hypothetical protein / location=Cvel_scaffold151:92400-93107(+) / protein_length=236 / sequence_SO=supercontig / SO=protein_coding / is_pseudo=false
MVFEWLVVGGGPIGTCAVGTLLQRCFDKVGWVERGEFKPLGRLSVYGSVPANTRNDRIVEAFCGLDAFVFEEKQRERPEGTQLFSQPPMKTARLQLSLDALRDGSESMRASCKDRLWSREGVCVIGMSSDGNLWRVETASGEILEARRVILATGGEPKVPDAFLTKRLEEAGIRVLHHDDVVVPSRLEEHSPSYRKLGVVGGSHSGMLAAMNFLSVKPTGSVCVLDRKSRPRFAEE